jgi:hypothetical protein
MVEAKALLFPPITFELGKEFRPRPSDVIITPWSKSGTTWLQQIAHGLRSGGDMNFDDISAVSPWIEVAYALGIDLDADQGWEPRLFKSHYSYRAVPKGCRYIVSFREPKRVMVSYYKFYEGWLFEPGTVTLDEYLAPHLDRSPGKDYWSHMSSWWEQRDNPDVLLLSYELMQQEPRQTVAAVADFLDIGADDALLDLVTHQSTLEFMLEHEDKFNDKMHRERGGEVGAHPVGIGSTKVTDGSWVGDRYELSEAVLAKMDQHWREAITEPFGFETYNELTEAIRTL